MAPSASGPEPLDNTLPASWFREDEMYELERRAIFSKTWILVSHSSQFLNAGQYAVYEMAGYPFFIMKDRDGNINAFLNVCRHRAFPLLHDEAGTAKILACKYHGWSYGISGKLAKAPRFDSVPEFDKSSYSLYKVHTHIDKLGFVWINLDSAEVPTTSWDQQFKEVDTQARLNRYDMSQYKFDHSWTLDGNFNWKTLVENYNECYHCSTAHPGIAPSITKDTKFDVEPNLCYIRHLGEEMEADEITASPTFMFPNASVTMSKDFFYMMSIVPVSAKTCKMRYEFYANKNSSKDDVLHGIEFFKQVEREDKWLADKAQTNLNSDTYMAGPLHPYMEKAVAYFESLLRPMLKNHLSQEKELGRQVWPARRNQRGEQVEEDEAFCRGVCDSSAEGKGAVDW